MADAARRTVLVVTTGYDEYQRWLVRGVRSVLPPDRHTIVVNSFNPTKRGLARPVVELIRELRPCGVLATSCVSPREETGLVDLLSELGVPTVRIGAQTPGMSCVRGDDATGMREVLRFLLDERGVRRPVLARGVPHQPDSLCRERVFREELAVRGIAVDEDLIIEGFFWHEATYLELRALLGRRRDLDAVVALNDLSALGAVKALGDEGLRVPEDVLVTGFDNDPAALPCWPQLTTVDPALEEQGAAAAAQLLAEVEHDAPRTEIVVPARLIVRGSTGLPPDCLAAAVSAATVGQQQLAARDALSALSFALSNCATPEDVVSTLGTSHLLRLGIRRFFLAVHVDGNKTEFLCTSQGIFVGEPVDGTSKGGGATLNYGDTLVVRGVAGSLGVNQVPAAWRESAIVHLGPLVQEVDPRMADAFPTSLVGVTPQGWLRAWREDGLVSAVRWESAERVLARADVVILSMEDLGDDREELERLRGLARLLVLTDGRHGATVYDGSRVTRVPAFDVQEVDPTGAGDVFAAAFFVRLHETQDPVEAARFANCEASFLVEAQGTSRVPTREQVEERLRFGRLRA